MTEEEKKEQKEKKLKAKKIRAKKLAEAKAALKDGTITEEQKKLLKKEKLRRKKIKEKEEAESPNAEEVKTEEPKTGQKRFSAPKAKTSAPSEVDLEKKVAEPYCDAIEKQFLSLLLKNKLITQTQIQRVLKTRAEEITLPEEIRNRNLVSEVMIKKIVSAIEKKSGAFNAYLGEM